MQIQTNSKNHNPAKKRHPYRHPFLKSVTHFSFSFQIVFGISSSQNFKEMSNQTFKVHLILKEDKTNKKGLAPIFARLRLNGKKIEISTNRNVLKENWSYETELALPLNKSLQNLNQYLESFKNSIYVGYTSLLSSGESISSESLKKAIFGKPVCKKYSLIEIARLHNEQFEKQVGFKYSYGSYKNYKTTLKYLIEFVPLFYKKNDIPLEQVDYRFCEGFFSYLSSKKKCKNNGANKQIQRIKKIVNYAIRLGYLSVNPMASYSLHFKPARKVPLTMEEINKLATLDIQRTTLREVRDVFIFQCFTGLSYSDIKFLKGSHIQEDAIGDLWIKMERQKTEISFSVPLLKPAVELLNKYYLEEDKSKPLFPVLSNQKMNENLKILQELAGIIKNLTTHLARHSFATTITLNNDVPIETVSKMLGHTNLRTTQLYAKVLDAKIGSDMQKLKEKLK